MSLDTTVEGMEDEEENEEEEIVMESETTLETPAKTIRALLSITKMLTESGNIRQTVIRDDLQGQGFRALPLTAMKTLASQIKELINILRLLWDSSSDLYQQLKSVRF